jgi:hypothetical protein
VKVNQRLGVDLAFVDEEEDPVDGDGAVREEDRVELDVGATEVQQPDENMSCFNIQSKIYDFDNLSKIRRDLTVYRKYNAIFTVFRKYGLR